MLSRTLVSTVLKNTFQMPDELVASLTETATRDRRPLDVVAMETRHLDEGQLYTAIGTALNIPLATLSGKDIPDDILHLIPGALAETHQVVAFEKTEADVSVAMLDPTDLQTIEFLRRKTGLTVRAFLAKPSEIKEVLRRLHHAEIERDVSRQSADIKGFQDLKKAAESLSAITLLNTILEHALYEGASDIHIEPTADDVQIRYRIDGVLKTAMTLPKAVQSGVTARVKVLGSLKIDEHMVPQDGRFKMTINDEQLSFRVSIMPVYDGEKIVMRILREAQQVLSLDKLGFHPEAKSIIERAIEKPHGMILVTGPTGSGKTTTLYTVLHMLNEPGVNICTIEDPIEYHVAGINQSQINPRAGFTFAGGLRAFLRQDPDIIMVGEIRDQETAEIAIHAAMTGHLVLSTLHTNDAPTTIPRLTDMDIPPFLIAFTINTIVAQRLVRVICPHCKEEYHLNEKELEELGKIADIEKMVAQCKALDLKLAADEKTFKTMTFYRGKGCAKCGDSGYKGRIGIYEVLEVDSEISKKINERANVEDIRDYAEKNGMIALLEDGLIKAKQGITTIEEILRATRD